MGREKIRPFSGVNSKKGSPPHGRGKELFNLLHVLRHRITPAWAGKSDSPPVCGWVWEDHPRVGGEKVA